MFPLTSIWGCLGLLGLLGRVFSLNSLNLDYEYGLLTESPLIQTAFAPALFRRACPSGYVSHLYK